MEILVFELKLYTECYKKQSGHKMNSFVLENDKNDAHSKFDV